jgi:hypothetical protein
LDPLPCPLSSNNQKFDYQKGIKKMKQERATFDATTTIVVMGKAVSNETNVNTQELLAILSGGETTGEAAEPTEATEDAKTNVATKKAASTKDAGSIEPVSTLCTGDAEANETTKEAESPKEPGFAEIGLTVAKADAETNEATEETGSQESIRCHRMPGESGMDLDILSTRAIDKTRRIPGPANSASAAQPTWSKESTMEMVEVESAVVGAAAVEAAEVEGAEAGAPAAPPLVLVAWGRAALAGRGARRTLGLAGH